MNLTKKPDDEAWDRAWRKEVTRNRNIWRGVAIAMLILNGGESVQRAFKQPDLIKEIAPFAYDQQTGVYQQMTSLDGKSLIAPSDAVTRANLQEFVESREEYDYYNMRRPYTKVKAMAVGNVAQDYNEYLDSESAKLMKENSIRLFANVTYVSPTGGETRSIRFTRTLVSGGKATTTNHVATITFEYDSGVELPLDQRMVNPLGFQVYYYNVEVDLGASS